jgi:hypothetical protein
MDDNIEWNGCRAHRITQQSKAKRAVLVLQCTSMIKTANAEQYVRFIREIDFYLVRNQIID